MHLLQQIFDTAYKVGEFFVVTVLFKYVFVHWVGHLAMKFFKRHFIRTEREAAIWLHYFNDSLNKVLKRDVL